MVSETIDLNREEIENRNEDTDRDGGDNSESNLDGRRGNYR